MQSLALFRVMICHMVRTLQHCALTVYHPQRAFNTGRRGKRPTKELIERANRVRQQWMNY
ncbi:MAG: hypothetical protein WBY44_15070 [Bryobacteraceae bacterium]